MEINVLIIDDEPIITKDVTEILKDELNIPNLDFIFKTTNDFDDALELLKNGKFDLVILDIYLGPADISNLDRPGEKILEEIKKYSFIPIIFYTGKETTVNMNKSNLIRVVNKSQGTDALIEEIKFLINEKLIEIKKSIFSVVEETLREFFWDFVQNEWTNLKKIKDKVSINHILIKRLSLSLQNHRVIEKISNEKVDTFKGHPMNYYVYPPLKIDEFMMGDILKKENDFYVILTPSCDFVLYEKNVPVVNEETDERINERLPTRHNERGILAKCLSLNKLKEYELFYDSIKNNRNRRITKESKNNLVNLIKQKKPRYFFLPGTFFLQGNRTVDFQDLYQFSYEELSEMEKIASICDPFAQSLQSSFIRYYNRVGYENFNLDYIVSEISSNIKPS